MGNEASAPKPDEASGEKMSARLLILYGSQTGTAKGLAEQLERACSSLVRTNHVGDDVKVPVNVVSMDEYEPEDLEKESFVVFVISSYESRTPPDNAKLFFSWLEDASKDFRMNKTFLGNTNFSVFGVGDSVYGKNYNAVGRGILSWMSRLGAEPFCSGGVGDVSIIREDEQGTPEGDMKRWIEEDFMPGAMELLESGAVSKTRKKKKGGQKQLEVEDEETEYSEYSDGFTEAVDGDDPADGPIDIEDMGKIIGDWQDKQEAENIIKDDDDDDEDDGVLRDMLTPKLRKSLEKQNYKLIGSHSGVKLCRWTKAMLRGRGGCYKHTFYNIASYQCMEMTPSLACANKCTFCWRHHTNPVAKEWKWNMDSAHMLVSEALEKHKKMIKVMKGVPGVKPERLAEAMSVKHCALSLVGEPIIYPEINEFLRILHGHEISSFMVTNAQFPDRIEILDPVTQLYVSVDASTKSQLKAIDRPVFTDFWERFLTCLKTLKEKQQRTVYRLTLVKGSNMEEIEQYAKLVSLGRPTFIEVKGVTFSGASKTSGMRMEHSPFHYEVRAFCEALANLLPNYDLACEHQHSCCILIADKRLMVDGTWHTWIDYPKFHELQKAYHETGATFTAFDYMAPTPSWAIYNSPEEGFDPEETRFRRKGKRTAKEVGEAAQAAELAASHGGENACCSGPGGGNPGEACCNGGGGESAQAEACCSAGGGSEQAGACCGGGGGGAEDGACGGGDEGSCACK